MRIILSVIFAALVVVGQWGARFLASSEHGREDVIGLLKSLDIWLLKELYSPTLLIIGLGGLFGIWVAMPVARLWREKWFGTTRREFLNQFSSNEQTIARRNFRWNLERAYRQYNPDAKSGELPDMLRQLKWPDDFPPENNVVAYSENIKWPDETGQTLWEFMDTLFCDVYDIKKRTERLDAPYYTPFTPRPENFLDR